VKKLVVVHIIFLAVAYYLVYIGLVGIGVPINYGYVPSNAYYQLYLQDNYALGIVLVGLLIGVLTYYHMEEHHEFKYKIMGKRHCEKTSFIWVFFVFLTVALLYFIYVAKNAIPIQVLELSAIVALSGYLGVLYYRMTNHKKILSVDSLKFWSAKA
jgi:hypothetical protein